MDETVAKAEIKDTSSRFDIKKLIGVFFVLVFLSHIALNVALTGKLYSPAVKQILLTALSFWAAIAYLFDKKFARGAATIYLVWRSITFLIGIAMVGANFGMFLALGVYISMLLVIWWSSSKNETEAKELLDWPLNDFVLIVIISSCLWVVYTTSAVLMNNL